MTQMNSANSSQVGCHVSIQDGIDKSPKRGQDLGCTVIQIFTHSPHGGKIPELEKETVKKFKENCKKHGIKNTYVHGPYFVNLASSNNRIKYGSISVTKIGLERASVLGAKYFVSHIGSMKDYGETESIKVVIESVKKILDGYSGSTKLLLENGSNVGKLIGSKFVELKKILNGLKKYESLAGICLDTQHSFAAGYDWKNDFENSIKDLEKNIGVGTVKLIHANDSISEAGSNKDAHEHIGHGNIGLNGFKKIKQFAVKNKIDLICETNYPGVLEDIETLKNL